MATMPKPSIKGTRPSMEEAVPIEMAMIKVTVIGPVATPPESKAIDTKVRFV